MAPRETENNAYTKFWDDRKSIMVCYDIFWSGQFHKISKGHTHHGQSRPALRRGQGIETF